MTDNDEKLLALVNNMLSNACPSDSESTEFRIETHCVAFIVRGKFVGEGDNRMFLLSHYTTEVC